MDALILAGEATGYFMEEPPKATKNAVNSVYGWWNDKNTYEKICTVVEAYIMYRMIASGRSKGKTVTLESEEAAGAIDGVAGEATEIAAEAGETGGIAGSEGIAAVEKAAGKGKIRIASAGESGSKTTRIGQWMSKSEYEFLLKQEKYLEPMYFAMEKKDILNKPILVTIM